MNKPSLPTPSSDKTLEDSVCDNGQTGVQDPDTDVCCPLECGIACGGEGCGTIPGVEASLCCAAAIIAAGVECDGTTTPCILTSVADEVGGSLDLPQRNPQCRRRKHLLRRGVQRPV